MKDYSILIGAIDEVIKDYDNGLIDYCWRDNARCNCGLIAQKIMKLSPIDLYEIFYIERMKLNKLRKGSQHLTWSNITDTCKNTNLPMPLITTTLLNAGFELDDFRYLEHLSNPIICSRAELIEHDNSLLVTSDFNQLNAFIKYIKTWKNILKEKQNNNRQSFIELKNIMKPVSVETME